MALTEQTLLAYLNKDLGIDTADISRTSPLFSSSLIDSFSLVSLITFVEEQTGIKVKPMDVNLENFDTIENILHYMDRVSQV
jgi:acyl carrier protein